MVFHRKELSGCKKVRKKVLLGCKKEPVGCRKEPVGCKKVHRKEWEELEE